VQLSGWAWPTRRSSASSTGTANENRSGGDGRSESHWSSRARSTRGTWTGSFSRPAGKNERARTASYRRVQGRPDPSALVRGHPGGPIFVCGLNNLPHPGVSGRYRLHEQAHSRTIVHRRRPALHPSRLPSGKRHIVDADAIGTTARRRLPDAGSW
jgi:hypothetical protein